MKYTLTCTYVEDDKFGVFTWALSNFEGVLHSDSIIALGERKSDRTYCGHIALRRALRQSAKLTEGVVDLTVKLDEGLIEAVGYELLPEVSTPLYPALKETTERALRRFEKYQLAQITEDVDGGMSVDEATALDEAEDRLERLRTIGGRLDLWFLRITAPTKIIK
ncbi:hypothetical protein GLW08_08175 [Pontibacillus yanchengensis]|uniref:Uncharacterized protein n=1 Tax=Pontibacillus yanchengensis TaxID=462910 RepID=A0ACC7VGJ7_9BACI|nr:hypothetical protein [Pontibacillus yanchengensis]MYL53314.1 hypothetical protein [Pontibacillus yanchengensis]